MNKILIIIKREYLTRVRKRLFIITTILTPVGIVAIFFLKFFLSSVSEDSKNILVCDEVGFTENKLENKDHLLFSYSDIKFEELKKQYKAKGYSGILHISSGFSMYEPETGIDYY